MPAPLLQFWSQRGLSLLQLAVNVHQGSNVVIVNNTVSNLHLNLDYSQKGVSNNSFLIGSFTLLLTNYKRVKTDITTKDDALL